MGSIFYIQYVLAVADIMISYVAPCYVLPKVLNLTTDPEGLPYKRRSENIIMSNMEEQLQKNTP